MTTEQMTFQAACHIITGNLASQKSLQGEMEDAEYMARIYQLAVALVHEHDRQWGDCSVICPATTNDEEANTPALLAACKLALHDLLPLGDASSSCKGCCSHPGEHQDDCSVPVIHAAIAQVQNNSQQEDRELREKRLAIAREVHGGDSVDLVAQKHRVSHIWVREACNEFGNMLKKTDAPKDP